MKRAGFTLGSTLLLITVALVAATSLSLIASFQMTSAARSRATLLTSNAAESALHMAIAREMSGGFTFGKTPDDRLEFRDDNGAVGIVTFARDERYENRLVAPSTFNYDPSGATSTAQGYLGRWIPRDGIHLVANGYWGTAVHRVECVLHLPSYPFAVGASGPLRLSGTLVASAKDSSSVNVGADGTVTVDEAHLDPGSVMSNGSTLAIDAGSTVTGDAQSVGTVTVAHSTVLGEVLNQADPVTIPTIDPQQYDPSVNQFCQVFAPVVDSSTVRGYVTTRGDLQVDGGLTLDNGVLYVKGNLTVSGGVVGTGAVITEGSASIRGAAIVNSNQNGGVTIFSDGDVTLNGDGSSSSFLRGLVYTNGRLNVSRLTVLGAVIQNQPRKSATLVDARIITTPGSSTTSLSMPSVLLTDNSQPPDVSGWTSRAQTELIDGSPPRLPARVPPMASASCDPAYQALPVANWAACVREDGTSILTDKDAITEWCFKHNVFGARVANNRLYFTWCLQGRGDGAGTGHGFDGHSVDPTKSRASLSADSPYKDCPVDNRAAPFGYLDITEFPGPMLDPRDGSVSDAELETMAEWFSKKVSINCLYMREHFGWRITESDLKTEMLAVLRQVVHRPSNRVPPGCNIQLDPNQYLSPADRVRVILWRDIDERR